MMNNWNATECHTDDHAGADISLSESTLGSVEVRVGTREQGIGPDTALCMAAWLIAYALRRKGLRSDAISFVVKTK